MCHPGKLGADLQHAATRLKESRAIRTGRAHLSGNPTVIERRGIELVSYRQLIGSA